MFDYMTTFWTPIYEDEGDDRNQDSKDLTNPSESKDSFDSNNNSSNKSFTQEQVNAIVAKEKINIKKSYEKRIAELERIRDNSNLTVKQVEELNAQIDSMRSDMMSKEELAKAEREKERSQFNKQLKDLELSRDTWKQRYTESTIWRSIIDAAVQYKAYNPDQIVAILQPHTKLVEELDDNKRPTGQYIPKVSYDTYDSDNKPIKLELTSAEAVKRMMEEKRFANLFISEKTSGLNLSNFDSDSQGTDNSQPPTDINKYIEWRKKQKK